MLFRTIDDLYEEDVKQSLRRILSRNEKTKNEIFTTQEVMAKVGMEMFYTIDGATYDVCFSFTKNEFLAILEESNRSEGNKRKVLDRLFERPVKIFDAFGKEFTIPSVKKCAAMTEAKIDKSIKDKLGKCFIM